MSKYVIFLVGPTAVGKTKIAFHLAKILKNAEIVSCDSMQVYKEISILNDKPSMYMRKIIKHHLIDIISVKQEFNVAYFFKLAYKTIEDILKREKTPICVGGSGMYVNLLLDGLDMRAGKNKTVREDLEKTFRERGLKYLYNKLSKVDPEISKKISPQDKKRIIRALEVYYLTGKPPSTLKEKFTGIYKLYPTKIFGITAPRDLIYENINQRVEKMFRKGVIEEIRKISNLEVSSTFQQIIGFKEIMQLLQNRWDLNKTKEEIKKRTRHFAKRQITWFKRDKRIQWIDINSFSNIYQISLFIYNYLKCLK